WRYASIPDLVRIIQAVVTSLVLTTAIVFVLNRLIGVPRSVFALDGVVLLLLLGGPRFFYRWLKDRRLYGSASKRALIIGAGQAGEMLVRDLLRDVRSPYLPVVFVDDDARKHGKDIHGIPVSG